MDAVQRPQRKDSLRGRVRLPLGKTGASLPARAPQRDSQAWRADPSVQTQTVPEDIGDEDDFAFEAAEVTTGVRVSLDPGDRRATWASTPSQMSRTASDDEWRDWWRFVEDLFDAI